MNFGTPAFFALGAYTATFLMLAFKAPFLVLLLAGGLIAGLLGLGLGYLTLRLKGVFFSIATLALTVVLQTLIMLGIRRRGERHQHHPAGDDTVLQQL